MGLISKARRGFLDFLFWYSTLLVMNVLQPDFFQRNTVHVAQDLLGCVLVREYNNQLLSGIIIETEAYTADDPACHAYRGKTERNAALFGPVGHAYVYLSYGIHYCMNIVAKEKSMTAGGVLIRALKPVEGIVTMKQLRGKAEIKQLANGPGKVAQALALTKKQSGMQLIPENGLYVLQPEEQRKLEITATPRIGISVAQDKLWRFCVDSQKVTGPFFNFLNQKD